MLNGLFSCRTACRAGRGLWHRLDRLRAGPAHRGIIPVRPELVAEVKFFGRYQRGWIRDGVLLSTHPLRG